MRPKKSYSQNPEDIRRGFTAVELLATASAVMLLLMLLLPFVRAARTTAQQYRCKDKLKRIALALHNYHDTFRTFPPGWITSYQDGNSHGGFGWQVFILPFVDQAPLYNRINFSEVLPRATDSDGLLTMALTVYQCPTDSEGSTNRFRGGYGRSGYTGSYGSVSPPRWSDGRVEAYWPGAVPAITYQLPSNRLLRQPVPGVADWRESQYGAFDGLFAWNSRVRMRDITDGPSNTMMVGERSKISQWGIWAGVGSNRFETDAVTSADHRSPLNRSLSGYSSPHKGGMYTALCDGSVKFISDEIDSKADGTGVFQAIASKNGNEVFPPDAFKRGPLELW